MAVVEVNGIDIYYEVHGSGPPLLAISGTGGDLRNSPPQLLPVTRHFETLAYDQRGLGRTSKPATNYTMAEYADDAAGLIRTMGWERGAVMGTSFGGMVALNLVVRHPDLVERLVLNCTSAGGESASYPLHELAGIDPEEAFARRMRLIDERWDPDADAPIPDLGAFYDAMVDGMRAVPSAAVADGARRQLAARAGHDVVDALGSIVCPTLVCAGRFDALAPLENSQFLVDRIPGARLEVFDGGHLFLVQDRTAWPAIIDFLNAA